MTLSRACTRSVTLSIAAIANTPVRLSLADQLHYARQGHGRSGACRDYVLAAVKELQTLGIKDIELQMLAERLKGAHETSSG